MSLDAYVPCGFDPRVLTSRDVINASRIVVWPGLQPMRIVLRALKRGDMVHEYVVHYEYLNTLDSKNTPHSCAFIHAAFETGDYFPLPDGDEKCGTTWKRALARFDERVAKL